MPCLRAITIGRVAEQFRDSRRVERRRHHEDAQVLAHFRLRFQAQRQAEIGVEAALVKLVEDHHRDAFERGVALQPAREDSFRHDLDARALAGARFQPRAKADGLTDRFAEHLRHARRDGARGETARLEHHDLAGARRLLGEQRKRDACRLARAGRRLQDDIRVRGDGRRSEGSAASIGREN